jgi:hypothetical protein
MKLVTQKTEERECARSGCTNVFPLFNPDKVYCSDACRRAVTAHASRTRQMLSKNRACKWCGQAFTGEAWSLLCPSCAEVRDDNRPVFVGVDGEGITGECLECEDCAVFTEGASLEDCNCGHPKKGKLTDARTGHAHKYVLLGVGDNQIVNRDGLEFTEILSFLYQCFEAQPQYRKTVFAGFYLGYDFTQWLKTLPPERAKHLLLDKRKSSSQNMQHMTLPVDYRGWQFDMLGERRFKLRPKVCDCQKYVCSHMKGVRWMYVCDSGPFFQTSFLTAINPRKYLMPTQCELCAKLKREWQALRPEQRYCSEHMVVTPEEYAIIQEGKAERETALLSDEMMLYNRLENEVLARVLTKLDEGFKAIGVNLSAKQWIGPGQPAGAWMATQGVIKHKELIKVVPEWALDAAMSSYLAGWFEIDGHGIIPGITDEYDINSAYPHIISKLPCLEHGKWERKTARTFWTEPIKLKRNQIALVYGSVEGSNPHIGAMLHRYDDKKFNPFDTRPGAYRIYRPHHTGGWYWQHELEAAMRAGLIDSVKLYKCVTYQPCDCPPPLRRIANLYQMRLKVGKDTPLGKAAKLVYTSSYGKFAQSVGDNPPFNNWVYASLITAGCRTQILDAIATHPGPPCAHCEAENRLGGPCQTVMIATDGVYFLSRHPGLPTSDKLGEWEHAEHSRLTLFKPGFYWNDTAREDIAKGDDPRFKSRGVSAKAFASVILQVDNDFQSWNDPLTRISKKSSVIHWPGARFALGFDMVSAKQAIRWNQWHLCGRVAQNYAAQESNPEAKRDFGAFDKERGFYRSRPYPGRKGELGGYEYSHGYIPRAMGLRSQEEEGIRSVSGVSPDGEWGNIVAEVMGLKG